MKNNILIRSNLVVSTIILIVFLITAGLSYQAKHRASLANIEQLPSLTDDDPCATNYR